MKKYFSTTPTFRLLYFKAFKIILIGFLLFFTTTYKTFAQTIDIVHKVIVTVDLSEKAYVEPVIVVHPDNSDHIVVASISMPVDNPDDFWDSWRVEVFLSTDAGENWEQVALPGLTTASGDPWLYWHNSGDLYLSVLARDENMKPYLYRSEDGGFTWSQPKRVLFSEDKAFDHPVIAGSSEETGNPLYLVSMGNFSSIVVSKYLPNEDRFEPLPVYEPDELNNAMTGAAVFPSGEFLYGFFTNSKGYPTPYNAIRSDNQGRSYSCSVISEAFIPVAFFPLVIDSTRNNRVYAVWIKSQSESGFSLNFSDDKGASWSDPVVVSTSSDASFTSRPFMAVNKQGHIGVSWVDNRYGDDSQCWDTFFSMSTDGGKTFLPEVKLSDRISCPDVDKMGMAASRFRWAGEYSGITTDEDGNFYVSYPMVDQNGIYAVYMAKIGLGFP